MFFKAGRKDPSQTPGAIKAFPWTLEPRAALQLLRLQAAPGTQGQGAGEQAAGQLSAACNSLGPGVHRLSCLG